MAHVADSSQQWLVPVGLAWRTPRASPEFCAVGAAGEDGRLDVFIVSQEAALWHIGKTVANSGWSDWVSHGSPSGVSFGSDSTPVVASSADGHLELFVVGNDGRLWQMRQTTPNGGWSGWRPHDAPSGMKFLRLRPAVASSLDGRLELFVVGDDASLWHLCPTGSNDSLVAVVFARRSGGGRVGGITGGRCRRGRQHAALCHGHRRSPVATVADRSQRRMVAVVFARDPSGDFATCGDHHRLRAASRSGGIHQGRVFRNATERTLHRPAVLNRIAAATTLLDATARAMRLPGTSLDFPRASSVLGLALGQQASTRDLSTLK